mmetsp:Transcript_11094/g.14611  ORF Transcript_11094/g.14611 Transcript_11094/m.14611 type:complete len:123 (+) Transcript_11094:531-899(+)
MQQMRHSQVPKRAKKKKGKQDDQIVPLILFDELDDEALAAGAAINPLITVVESTTLGASLQLTGEQSRFVPDWLGPTMAALWEGCGVKVSWESFFVDPVYRPNPKDYYPSEQIFQFTISASK